MNFFEGRRAGIIVALIVLALAVGFYLFWVSPVESFAFHVVEEGVDFYSNEGPPGSLLQGLSEQDSFILIHSFHAQGPLNSFMSQSLNTLQAVLAANQKKTWVVARVEDVQGTWSGCQTDYGTGKASEFISVEECVHYLGTLNGVVVRVHAPIERLRRPKVVVSALQAEVFVGRAEELPSVTFLVARTLFSNALVAVNAANEIASQIGAKGDSAGG